MITSRSETQSPTSLSGQSIALCKGAKSRFFFCSWERFAKTCFGFNGAFDATGRFLFICDYDYQAGVGGVSPHELVFDVSSGRLVIAQVSVLTNPDTGCTKLSLALICPTLSYLDPTMANCWRSPRRAARGFTCSLRNLEHSNLRSRSNMFAASPRY